MSQPAEEPTVEVTVEVEAETPAPEPEQDTAPEVVVVDTGSNDAPTDALVENAITTEGRLANLENGVQTILGYIAAQQEQMIEQEQRVEIAEATADLAVEVAVEAAEGEQVEAEQDTEPEREHGFFRTWFGK